MDPAYETWDHSAMLDIKCHMCHEVATDRVPRHPVASGREGRRSGGPGVAAGRGFAGAGRGVAGDPPAAAGGRDTATSGRPERPGGRVRGAGPARADVGR